MTSHVIWNGTDKIQPGIAQISVIFFGKIVGIAIPKHAIGSPPCAAGHDRAAACYVEGKFCRMASRTNFRKPIFAQKRFFKRLCSCNYILCIVRHILFFSAFDPLFEYDEDSLSRFSRKRKTVASCLYRCCSLDHFKAVGIVKP